MNGHQNDAFSCLTGALNSPRKVNGYGADYVPEGFLQLGGILGKAHKDFSWEDLREEALEEKYGV